MNVSSQYFSLLAEFFKFHIWAPFESKYQPLSGTINVSPHLIFIKQNWFSWYFLFLCFRTDRLRCTWPPARATLRQSPPSSSAAATSGSRTLWVSQITSQTRDPVYNPRMKILWDMVLCHCLVPDKVIVGAILINPDSLPISERPHSATKSRGRRSSRHREAAPEAGGQCRSSGRSGEWWKIFVILRFEQRTLLTKYEHIFCSIG